MKLSPVKNLLYYLLQFSWGIIQNVIGLLLWLILLLINPHRLIKTFYGCIVSYWRLNNSLSLGIFIFMGSNDDAVLVHELGHSIQSIILGPLYLLIIGIPSFIWATFLVKLRRRKKLNYYNLYTEKWANHLAKLATGLHPVER